jgi:D-arabinan exo alpha-(1,3)/(1,5)-arabinofuranosidase (non-reducing end)
MEICMTLGIKQLFVSTVFLILIPALLSPVFSENLLLDLPLLNRDKCAQVSSHDRTGGNDDGFMGTYSSLGLDENGDQIIFEHTGPGRIDHLWFTDIYPAERIRFYFDGRPEPDIDLAIHKLFDNSTYPFEYPLAADNRQASGGFVTYIPMPFGKSCRIVTVAKARFYHVAYRSYEEGPRYETAKYPLSIKKRADLARIRGSLEKAGEAPSHLRGMKKLVIPMTLEAQAENELYSVEKSGRICGLVIRPASEELKASPEVLRKIMLRAYWDYENQASIQSPLLDFFGCGFEYAEVKSLPIGMTEAGMYCWLPMPFRRSARLTLENGNDMEVDLEIELYVDYGYYPEPNAGTLHAQWKRRLAEEDKSIELCDAAGWGKYVGTTITFQGRDGIGYLEGDERIFIDNEEEPSIHGTGTEDYFNSGWYYSEGTYSMPFHGLSYKDEPNARICSYRFHIIDAISFQSRIQATIEHGTKNNATGVLYDTVAYWYQLEPHLEFAEVPPAREVFIPGEPYRVHEKIMDVERFSKFTSSSAEYIVRKGTSVLPVWSGGDHVWLQGEEAGDSITFNYKSQFTENWDVSIGVIKGPDCADFTVSIDSIPLGPEIKPYSSEYVSPEEIFLGRILLEPGEHNMTLSTTGKPEKADGYNIGIDFLRFNKTSPFIRELNVIGPFPNDGEVDWERDFGPEGREIDLDAEHQGTDSRMVRWQSLAANNKGFIDLNENMEPHDNVLAYSSVFAHSPDDREVYFFLGSDDGVKVWVNGEEVWENYIPRGSAPDQDMFPVNLKRGWNEILLKIEERRGGWGFYFRPMNPSNELKFTTRRK